ncbi:MAG: type II secretion system inner membrane protein GspF [Nevskia sp.]|nr:type II secretion system inner membrane protein GspF [Nevskia sp.]
MSAYEYSALDTRGRQVKGLIEGDTQRQVRQLLRERSLTPLDIKEVAEKASRSSRASLPITRGGSLNSTELSLFTRQLATLTRSGLPLDEALAAVSQQSESKRVQRVTLGVRSRVTEGNSLARAMGEFPGAFPTLFRATIEAGESAGKLDSVLERLADYAERSQAIRSKVMLATFYPATLTVVAIGVISLLMSYVVPKVVGVFDSIGADLPPLTKGLIATSEFLQNYGFGIFIALLLGAFAFRRALNNDGFRRKYHHWVLRLPLIGRLVRGANTGRFMRTLGILFGAGVPILDALRIGSQVVENLPMKEAIDAAAKRVREGASLNKSLAESRLFPPITMHLIASGESSGKLDDMLDRAAENQERELETLISALMSLFEPILILTMGTVVLLIVLAILLPIFNLNQLVQ